MAAFLVTHSLYEPLQILTTSGAAINFGGSVSQSPLIMPTLQSRTVPVPVHYTAQQTAYLLHNSEHFFPPSNALCTLTNSSSTGTAYLNREDGDGVLGAKLPSSGAAAASNVATTAWALGIMVPMNKRMAVLARKLEGGREDKVAEGEFVGLQDRWRKWNYGRAAIMLASAVVGAVALVTRA